MAKPRKKQRCPTIARAGERLSQRADRTIARCKAKKLKCAESIIAHLQDVRLKGAHAAMQANAGRCSAAAAQFTQAWSMYHDAHSVISLEKMKKKHGWGF